MSKRPKVKPKYRGPSRRWTARRESIQKFRGVQFLTRKRGTARQIGQKFPVTSPRMYGQKLPPFLEELREKAKHYAMLTARELGRLRAFPTELKEEYERAKKERPGLTPTQFEKEKATDGGMTLEEWRKENGIPAVYKPTKTEPPTKYAPEIKPATEDFYSPENIYKRATRLLIAKARRPYGLAPWQRKKLEEDIARLEKIQTEAYSVEESIKRAELGGRPTGELLQRRMQIHQQLRAMGGKVKYWLQKAIKKPGVLRMHVQRTYGNAGFDSKGRIKLPVLKELAKDGIWGKRARLALLLRKFKRRGGKERPTREVYDPEEYERWKRAQVLERTIPLPKYTEKEVKDIKRYIAKRKRKIPKYHPKQVERAIALME